MTDFTFPLLIGSAIFAGMTAGRAIFQGGWQRRWTHKDCGWFEVHGFELPSNGDPCPRCGEINSNWFWRIGRPIPFLPFGLQWKADTITSNVDPFVGRDIHAAHHVTRNDDGSVKSIKATWTGARK